MDAETATVLSEIRELTIDEEWSAEKAIQEIDELTAKRALEELTLDTACLEFCAFNKYDILHIKYDLMKSHLMWIHCALMGNMKECGIPNLPIKLPQYYEEWNEHLTFDKTLTEPTKKHLKMAQIISEKIDEQEVIAEEAYQTALASARKNGDNPGLIYHNNKYEALLNKATQLGKRQKTE
jgi:hypothetical protein